MRSDPPSLPPPQPGHDVADGAAGFSEPRRLHPASVVLGIPLFQAVQALVLPAFATLAAGRVFTLGLFALVGAVALPLRILDWQRRLYSFDGEVLRVDSGVIGRSHRSLDVARIQQVEIGRGAVQRLFGLASLRVETAGSANEPEVDLRVVREADAVALQTAVRASKARRDAPAGGAPAPGDRPDAHAEHAEERTILRVPPAHVALAAVTGARLLVLPAVIGGALQLAWEQLGSRIDDELQRLVDLGLATPQGDTFARPGWGVVVVGIVLVVLLAATAAVVTGLLRDGRFTIVLRRGDLHVTRGLLSTRESVLPLRRVQLVQVQRNWIRRALGYSTVRIRSAGGSAGGEGQVSVPLLPDREVTALLEAVLPGTQGVPTLERHPPEALRRSILRAVRPVLVLLAAIWVATRVVPALDGHPVTDRLWMLALVAIAGAVAMGVVGYRQLAHGRTDRLVAARQGALSVTTTVAPLVKAQAVSTRSSWFQRRLGLATLTVHVAGPAATVEVLDAGIERIETLREELTEHAATPLPRPQPAV